MLQIFLAVLHLFALAIGLPAVLGRARALGRSGRKTLGDEVLRRVARRWTGTDPFRARRAHARTPAVELGGALAGLADD